MKRYLLLLGTFLLFLEMSAQKRVFLPGPVQMTQLADPVWKSKTLDAGSSWGRLDGVNGTMFYTDDWVNGYILLEDNRIVKDIPLDFNVYTNEIYFQHDSQVSVIDPAIAVQEFGFTEQKDKAGKIKVFRCGYPPIGKNTISSYYEVLVKNKLSLLIHRNKKITEKNNGLSGPEKIFTDSETWYVFDMGEQKITEIKKNKNALVKALPKYEKNIESIIEKNGLDLKKNEDWIVLFNALNN
jgi:hypothetical protein